MGTPCAIWVYTIHKHIHAMYSIKASYYYICEIYYEITLLMLHQSRGLLLCHEHDSHHIRPTNQIQNETKPNETDWNRTVPNATNRDSTEQHRSSCSSSNHFAFKIKCSIEMCMKMSLWKFCNKNNDTSAMIAIVVVIVVIVVRQRRPATAIVGEGASDDKTIIKWCCSILLKCM